MKISICMVVKNESKKLKNCLKSLETILDTVESELVIIDMGSDDNTVKIAKRYTNNVYLDMWNNNYSQLRNISISYAKGEWVFILDADEVFRESAKLIDFLMSKHSEKINTIALWKNNINSKKLFKTEDLIQKRVLEKRLFRRGDFKYHSRKINYPIFKEPIKSINCNIISYGCNPKDNKVNNEFNEINNYKILQSVSRYLKYFNVEEKIDMDEFEKIDFKKAKEYYGDIYYYLMKIKEPIYKFTIGVSEKKFNIFFKYLSKNRELSFLIYDYITTYNSENLFEEIRINRLLTRNSLLLGILNGFKYKDTFDRYIKYGISYLKCIYKSDIIEKEMIYIVKEDEERFLIFMYHALKNKKISKKIYIEYLEKALKEYPVMRKALKILINESSV